MKVTRFSLTLLRSIAVATLLTVAFVNVPHPKLITPSAKPNPKASLKAPKWPTVGVAAIAAQLPHTTSPSPHPFLGFNTIDEEFTNWKPNRKDLLTPHEDNRVILPSLEGIWGMDSASMKLTLLSEDLYQVSFHGRSGCLSFWHLNRMARYLNGVLVLDRPVKGRGIYQSLYTVQVQGKYFLVPEPNINLFQKMLTYKDSELKYKRDFFLNFYAFTSKTISPLKQNPKGDMRRQSNLRQTTASLGHRL